MKDYSKDGGTAYPHTDQGVASSTGMSLRDYFAGQALTGMCGAFQAGHISVDWFEKAGADAAYRIADAMLKAKERCDG